MNTVITELDRVRLTCPADAPWFFLPHKKIAEYGQVCGVGDENSFRQRVVPDTILGLRVSVACWIHDLWQANCPKTDYDFKQSNSAFFANLMAINSAHGGAWYAKISRVPFFAVYWFGVSSKAGLENFIK